MSEIKNTATGIGMRPKREGPPPSKGRKLSVYFTDEVRDGLKLLAKKRNLSFSEVVNRACALGIKTLRGLE